MQPTVFSNVPNQIKLHARKINYNLQMPKLYPKLRNLHNLKLILTSIKYILQTHSKKFALSY